jgi:hypothetical protein
LAINIDLLLIALCRASLASSSSSSFFFSSPLTVKPVKLAFVKNAIPLLFFFDRRRCVLRAAEKIASSPAHRRWVWTNLALVVVVVVVVVVAVNIAFFIARYFG